MRSHHIHLLLIDGPIVSFRECTLKDDVREPVRITIQDALNGFLEEEADDLIGADREADRAGHCDRKLTTMSGKVTIRMPKLKGMCFATTIIELCRRHETNVEEAMIEMHPAGVSIRRIEDVFKILWGPSVSASTVPNLNKNAFAAVEEWRSRPLERACPYVHVVCEIIILFLCKQNVRLSISQHMGMEF